MRPTEEESEQYRRGIEVRREVLGAEHVERSLAAADDFTMPAQKLITEWCWGEIWTRPGLERKTRSIINLALLSAMNRQQELKAHVRGALRNGVTVDEIREVLLQVAVYCGAPAALDSFRTAAEVVREAGPQERSKG